MNTPLRDVIEIQNGYAFPSKNFSTLKGTPLIRIRDLKSGKSTQTNFIGDFDSAYLVEAGDLLIGMDGEFRCHEWKGEPSLLNQRVCRIKKKSDLLDLRYLFYGINSHLKTIEDATGFTTVKHLSSKTILNIEFPIPALETQRSVVEKLDKFVESIELLIEQNEARSIHLKQIYEHEIERIFFKNINNWPVTTMEKTCDYKNGKAHEQLVSPNGKYRLVTSKFVSTNGVFARRVTAALTPLVSGDVAFVLSDLPNGKALAKAFLVTTETDLTLNQRVLRVRSENFDSNFLYFLINRNPYLRSFDNGESQTHLKLAQVLACPLFMPDLDTQVASSSRMRELKAVIDDSVQILENKLALLKELKESVLYETFNQQHAKEEVA
jgi:type I restriction enzyme S subunit